MKTVLAKVGLNIKAHSNSNNNQTLKITRKLFNFICLKLNN